MRIAIVTFLALLASASLQAKTLVVYYSYTNNVERIVDALRTKIYADIIEIEPAQKGLDYAADNYAIGSSQITDIRNNPDDASSYPAIDPVDVSLSDYDCIIIGVPLWWSNMAAPLQTFLFQHGKEMAGKKIGLITRVRDKNLQFTTKLKDKVYWATCQGRPIYLHRFKLIPEGKLPV